MDSSDNLALLTDLYQLTMAQGYFRERKTGTASFSLFIRSYPPNRGYFIAAGLSDVLDYLETFRFEASALDYLSSLRLFSADFLHFLADLRFTGEVWALPEGQVFFTGEPVLEVTAPIIEAQLVETFIINQINFQSLVATKAARCVSAAGGRAVVDFALRRTQGTDAGMKVARATFIAGFAGTSNVRAAQVYGIPPVGTMAHSFVSAFDNELDAFRAYAATFPKNAILLIDTYNTLQGARHAVTVAEEMAARGERLSGVRIDSGDLPALARRTREILDQAGLEDVKIIGSGGLDEHDLQRFSTERAPFDSYGVGTKVGVSADAPWADTAYKLVEYDGRPVLKLSEGKQSWPGRKQVFRFAADHGSMLEDVIALREEQVAGAEPLLERVMQRGRVAVPLPSLEGTKSRCCAELARLPERYRRVIDPERYRVTFSTRLEEQRRTAEKARAS
jgi:nicotinate phosphoribosyltransferase